MNYQEIPVAENVENERKVEHGVLKFNGIAEEFRSNVLSDFMNCSREISEFLVYNRGDEERLTAEKNKLVTSLSVFKRVVEDLCNEPENESLKYGLEKIISNTETLLQDIKTDKHALLAMALERFRGEISGIQTMSRTLLNE